METNKINSIKKPVAQKILIIFTAAFIGLMICAWAFSMDLRQKIVEKNSLSKSKVQAVVEIARLRNLSDSQISNSLSFFSMGSTHFFEEQKKDKQTLTESLAEFEKSFNLPGVSDSIQRIGTYRLQQQDFFEQAQQFRAKQTESKIVGQFYRSKTAPLRVSINNSFNEILELHNADFKKSQATEIQSAKLLESQIPKGLFWFTILISVLFGGFIFFILRLISASQRHNAERDRLSIAAQSASHTTDGVISAVSQDFNEHLTEIKKTSENMKTLADSNPFKSGIELFQSHINAMESCIQDILDETKSDMGHLNLRVEQLELDSILDEAKMFVEAKAKEKDIKLEFNPINPPVLAFIDRPRVLRVLSQLVGNAIKFSPKQSKVIVKVRSDQQFVFVSIKDNGPGISEKKLQTIFNNFWQARKTADLGAGVGLSISKKIIESHGGMLTVESHPGHGSTFTFSLPRRRPATAFLKKPAALAVRTANA